MKAPHKGHTQMKDEEEARKDPTTMQPRIIREIKLTLLERRTLLPVEKRPPRAITRSMNAFLTQMKCRRYHFLPSKISRVTQLIKGILCGEENLETESLEGDSVAGVATRCNKCIFSISSSTIIIRITNKAMLRKK